MVIHITNLKNHQNYHHYPSTATQKILFRKWKKVNICVCARNYGQVWLWRRLCLGGNLHPHFDYWIHQLNTCVINTITRASSSVVNCHRHCHHHHHHHPRSGSDVDGATTLAIGTGPSWETPTVFLRSSTTPCRWVFSFVGNSMTRRRLACCWIIAFCNTKDESDGIIINIHRRESLQGSRWQFLFQLLVVSSVSCKGYIFIHYH